MAGSNGVPGNCVGEESAKMMKSMGDSSEYKKIRLENGLEAVIVHNRSFDASSACLTVDIGSINDPTDMPGLAHAIEHSVMMGSQKFPNPLEYRSFISKHGGLSNASTLVRFTQYFFSIPITTTEPDGDDCQSSVLFAALDRFAAMFSSPTFPAEAVKTEVNAINEEHLKNVPDDMWRLTHIERMVARPDHPFNHFSTGTTDTLLGLSPSSVSSAVVVASKVGRLRSRLADFFNTHYLANRMKLAVCGSQPMAVLEKWTTDLFASIRSGPIPTLTIDHLPYTAQDVIGKTVWVRPAAPIQEIRMVFPYPDQNADYLTKPFRYIVHLLSHKSAGSLTADLVTRGLAVDVNASYECFYRGAAAIRLTVSATMAGISNYDSVVETVFRYIRAVLAPSQSANPGRSIPSIDVVQDLIDTERAQLELCHPLSSVETAKRISDNLNTGYAWPHLLTGLRFIQTFDPAAITTGIECLRPDNFFLIVVANVHDRLVGRVEHHYKIQYGVSPIGPDLIQSLDAIWNRDDGNASNPFFLPARNQYVPYPHGWTAAVPDPAGDTVHHSSRLRVWHVRPDQTASTSVLPRCVVRIRVKTGLTRIPFSMAMLVVHVEMVKQQLAKRCFPAVAAGYSFSIAVSNAGIDVVVDGYDDHIAELVSHIINHLTDRDGSTSTDDAKARARQFDLAKILLSNEYSSHQSGSSPHLSIGPILATLTSVSTHSREQIGKALQLVTLDRLAGFGSRLATADPSFGESNPQVEMLCYGSTLTSSHVDQLTAAATFVDPVVLASTTAADPDCPAFAPNTTYLFHQPVGVANSVSTSCINHAIIVSATFNLRLYALTTLLASLSHTFIYDFLRYEKQVSYLQWAYLLPTKAGKQPIGIAVLLQATVDSTVGGCAKLDADVADVWIAFGDQLGALVSADASSKPKSKSKSKSKSKAKAKAKAKSTPSPASPTTPSANRLDFEGAKRRTIADMLAPPASFSAAASSKWDSIVGQPAQTSRPHADGQTAIVEVVRSITVHDMLDFFGLYIDPRRPTKSSRVLIHLDGSTHKPSLQSARLKSLADPLVSQGAVVDIGSDIVAFKRKLAAPSH